MRPFSFSPFFSGAGFFGAGFFRARSFRPGCLAVVAGSVACGSPLTVSDRNDFAKETESIRAYATGSVVELNVKSSSILVDDDEIVGSSADEDVFTVESSENGLIQLRTLAPGEAELVLKLDDDVVDSRTIAVRDAEAVEMFLDVKALEEDDVVPIPREVLRPVRVLRGRTARLAVQPKDDDGIELFGQALTAVSTSLPPPPKGEEPVADGWTSSILVDGSRSFVEVAPAADAVDSVLHLSVGNALVVDVEVRVVDEAALERIVLEEEAGGFRAPGRRSVVLARGEDRDGNTILGAPAWTIEGADVGVGEAASYEVAWLSSKELVARIGSVEARRQVDADPNTVGVVRVGESCSAAGVGLPLALLALLSRRRARR